ncbi:MAG: hypothetical protein ACREJD_11025 [Phycisphaerales bacterium]
MTPSLHPHLLSAFLAGKSCASIATDFSLSIEEVLTWFESDLTQSTLRRLESLQLQQARIVSFSVLPGVTDSLTNTSNTAADPTLRTRAASNLLRLGLRFAAPASSSARSLQHDPSGVAASAEPAPEIATPAAPRQSTRYSHSSAPSDPFVPSDSSAPSASRAPSTLLCESLRAEFAALRAASTGDTDDFSPPLGASHEHEDFESAGIFHPAPALEPVAPLLSRRASRISSLRSSAGAAKVRADTARHFAGVG